MKRLFAAIKVHPSEAFLARYFRLKKALAGEKIRWVDPGNIHITLKFFGETPEHHIPAISAALRQAAGKSQAFSFEVFDTGIFGSSYKPRVIWFGIQPAEALAELAETVFSELEGIGIMRDRQNFVPHLSIARIKQLDNKHLFQQAIDKEKQGFIQKEEVEQFHLFESILRPQGPEYRILNTYGLGR